jgi:hypothetical protein
MLGDRRDRRSPPVWRTWTTATSTALGLRPQVPPRRRQEGRGRQGTRLLPEQRPPHALPLIQLTRGCSPVRRRRGRLQGRHRAKAEAGRHALGHGRRRRHRPPALPQGLQLAGTHLQHSARSDTHGLISASPKMVLTTYRIDSHPAVGVRTYPSGSCLPPFGQSSPSGTETHGAGGSGGKLTGVVQTSRVMGLWHFLHVLRCVMESAMIQPCPVRRRATACTSCPLTCRMV